MTPRRLRQGGSVMRPAKSSRNSITSLVEYGYFGLLIVSFVASERLMIPALGGAMNLALAAYCIKQLGSRVISPIVMPLACATSYLLVQYLVHGESLSHPYVKPFILWSSQLIIVQAMSFREGFIHRFAIQMLVVGLCLLPHVEFVMQDIDWGRATLDASVGLANPNDLGRWFGFLAVYFTTTGLESKRGIVRACYWAVALGSMYIVALTVGRGAISAVLIAVIVTFRRLLKRGFIPVLTLSILLFIVHQAGLFQPMVDRFKVRTQEDSGRLTVWNLGLQRLIDSPLTGEGASHTGIDVREMGRGITTPHNPFLFLALASGIVPLIFFLLYLIQAVRSTLRACRQRRPDAPLFCSLLVFVLVAIIPASLDFASQWAMVTLTVILTPLVASYRPSTISWKMNLRRHSIRRRVAADVTPMPDVGLPVRTSVEP